ncbi:MAG: aspartate aminotransferase family protein [Dehalococcoidia bacterium]|nr:MAG: aspartate aminotransferase family protein [Dehalococcoidia bacterium]
MLQVASEIDCQIDPRPKSTLTAHSPEECADDVLVGGSNSAFALPVKICLERGSGSRVWDESEREYVDFLLGSGPMILGHAHPRVCEAIARQLSKGSVFHTLNRPAVELAGRLVEIPGCVEMVRFASTGTEATLHSVRLARAYTGRDKVLVFAGSYHGSHDLSIIGHRGAARAESGGVPRSAIEDTVVARFNDVSSIEASFAVHGSSLAAVLVEPQQRSLDPLPEFLPRLARLCRSAGVVLIFDEVLTGFRLAFGGAQEYYGVEPDVVCYGKIVGGGFPLSAIGGRREIMRLADPTQASAPNFVHVSGTLSGNPVSAVAGLATLAELEEPGVYERLHRLGERLRSGLAGQLNAHDVGGSVIGSGPIAAVEFSDPDGARSGLVLREAVNRDLILQGVLVQLQTRFYISLVHTETEIDFAVDAFGAALEGAIQRPSAASTLNSHAAPTRFL